MHLMKIGGPSDHNDRLSTQMLSNKKVYIERLDCSTVDILLSVIKSKFTTSTMLAASISSAKPQRFIEKMFKSLLLNYNIKKLNNRW